MGTESVEKACHDRHLGFKIHISIWFPLYLPPEVVARLDPEHPPVHVEGTAIDGEGSRTQSDAIFRLHLRDGSEAIVYTLLEHKSQVDHRTPLQLIRYVLKIWAMEMDTGHFPVGGLPLVIPIVFFHGREPWTVPCSIQEMIHAPEGLEHLARSFGHYVLHDLGRIAPQELSRSAEVRAALLALARAFRDSVSDADDDLLVAGVAETELGRYILTYIIEQVSLPPERIEAALVRVGTDPMTCSQSPFRYVIENRIFSDSGSLLTDAARQVWPEHPDCRVRLPV